MLEDARATEESGHPDRMERRHFGKLDRELRSGNRGRRISQGDAALQHGDGALVLRMRSVGMEVSVQPRRRCQREGEEKRRQRGERESRAPDGKPVAVLLRLH